MPQLLRESGKQVASHHRILLKERPNVGRILLRGLLRIDESLEPRQHGEARLHVACEARQYVPLKAVELLETVECLITHGHLNVS